jgi:hypothetical protein
MLNENTTLTLLIDFIINQKRIAAKSKTLHSTKTASRPNQLSVIMHKQVFRAYTILTLKCFMHPCSQMYAII